MTKPRRQAKKFALAGLLLLVLGVSLLIYLLPLKELLGQSQQIKAWLAQTGYAAPLVFFAGSAMLTAVGMPRLLLCTLAGMVFGFTWGFIASHFGTVSGAYLTFVFARWSGRDAVAHRFPQVLAWSEAVQGKGWQSVLLMRQLPISGLYNDIIMGLSAVSHRDFWIGTLIGFLPLGITASLVGAGALQADMTHLAQYFGIAVVAFFLLPMSLKWLLAQRQRKSLNAS